MYCDCQNVGRARIDNLQIFRKGFRVKIYGTTLANEDFFNEAKSR
jgi:hypothetical protein